MGNGLLTPTSPNCSCLLDSSLHWTLTCLEAAEACRGQQSIVGEAAPVSHSGLGVVSPLLLQSSIAWPQLVLCARTVMWPHCSLAPQVPMSERHSLSRARSGQLSTFHCGSSGSHALQDCDGLLLCIVLSVRREVLVFACV